MAQSLDGFAAELLGAAAGALAVTRPVVEKAALNVKSQARRNVQQTAPVHNAHAHNAITYDVSTTPTRIEAEVGYDKDLPGGALGNLLEYGSRNSAPHRDLGRAADDEETRLENFIARAAGRLL